MTTEKNTSITIDELLAAQSRPSLQATVEAVEGKTDVVKVTPWTPSSGCLCHLSLVILKTSLIGATPTGETHNCCGKTLKVVELHFKKDESISLEDVFSQLDASTHKKSSPHHDHGPDQEQARYTLSQLQHLFPPVGGPINPRLNPWYSAHPIIHGRFPVPPGNLCNTEYNYCTERCLHSYDSEFCNCQCRAAHSMCMGFNPMPCFPRE